MAYGTTVARGHRSKNRAGYASVRREIPENCGDGDEWFMQTAERAISRRAQHFGQHAPERNYTRFARIGCAVPRFSTGTAPGNRTESHFDHSPEHFL